MKLGWKRLLKLADILDVADAKHRAKGEPTYRQGIFQHDDCCGTPACAIGHWAAQAAQRKRGWGLDDRLLAFHDRHARCAGPEIMAEFEISRAEASDLFCGGGCDWANTAKQAARYIRKFVKRKQAELAEARK